MTGLKTPNHVTLPYFLTIIIIIIIIIIIH